MTYTPIDFAGLNAALLDRAEQLVAAWLPGGKRVGHEYVCADLSGGEGRSCSVNLKSGAWGDFSAGEAGKDLISLRAAQLGCSQPDAARAIMSELGWAPATAVQAPAPRPRPAPAPAPRESEGWCTQRPVPPHAPAATFKHFHRSPADLVHTAEYRVGDELHGYVVRFATSDGGKDTLPHTWCVSARDAGARWHWKQWDEPRPLYLPGHSLPAGRTVVLVEGERKAETLQQLLDVGAPRVYCVASWPGGCKAWRKAEWQWLAGCHVLAWPDCDAKREPLTADEKRATPDQVARQVLQQAKPLLPAHAQPGMAAMLAIGALLRDEHGCTVQLLPIPAPSEVADGWDCHDAIATDGWDFARVLALFAGAYALPADPAASVSAAATGDEPPWPGADGLAGADGGKPGGGAGAPGGADDDEDAFAAHLAYMCDLLKCKPWELNVNRKLLIAALVKAPALAGCVGFNELTGAPGTVRAWPWRTDARPLDETDDLRLGHWLSAEYKLKPASRAALAEAIATVADMHRYHPVRDWLRAQQWDGKPRLAKWLQHVLGMPPDSVPPRRAEYLSLMGRYTLLGLVARVMEPGIKFDYSPVLEGLTGVGKSTFVKELVGPAYFSDTHFDIGDGKTGMEQLEGLWAYELSEMTAFRRADSEQVKQFFSSTVDRFRGAYGKFVQPHPRQCVIFCTTNKRQYLYDMTGNRRFWPVWIDKPINLEWVRKWRGQLFAEALAQWREGARIVPTREEEERCFVPEQRLRLVESTVQGKLYELLTREGGAINESNTTAHLCVLSTFVTMSQLVQALGADPAKATPGLESQIRSWMDAAGWMWRRSSTGTRPYGYRRPEVWPPEIADDDMEHPGASPGHAADMADGAPAQVPPSDGSSDDEPF